MSVHDSLEQHILSLKKKKFQQREGEVLFELPRWNIEAAGDEGATGAATTSSSNKKKANLRLGGWRIKREDDDPVSVRLPQRKSQKKGKEEDDPRDSAVDDDDDGDGGDGGDGGGDAQDVRDGSEPRISREEKEKRRREKKFQKIQGKVVHRYREMKFRGRKEEEDGGTTS